LLLCVLRVVVLGTFLKKKRPENVTFKYNNMNRKQKITVYFFANRQKVKDGNLALYIRIRIDGSFSTVSTGKFVNPQIWDQQRGKLKGSTPMAHSLNAYIDKVRNDMQQYFMDKQARGLLVTTKELKDKFLGVEEKEKEVTILEAFEYHNLNMLERARAGIIAKKTHTRYEIAKNKMIAFMKAKYKTSDMPLKDLKITFISGFEHFLRTKENLMANSAYKYMKSLKRVMNLSVEMEWIPMNPFVNYKCAFYSPEREILNEEEIEILINKELISPRMATIRDVFVFCCYTGFAYAEVYKFKRDAITRGIDGELWITAHRTKTGIRESVPLLPVALEIIERYREDPYCVKNNKLLPVLSNQRYNSYLKELAAICGLKHELTSHIARHTFATTVTLSNGVPIETVSKMLGHTRLATTQIYAKVLDTKVSQDMNVLKNVLEKKTKRNDPPEDSKILKIG
jgi:site-specific recombinase XerD